MNKMTKFSASNMLTNLNLDSAKWNRIPSKQNIALAVKSIEARGIEVLRIQDGDQALSKIKELIPPLRSQRHRYDRGTGVM